MSTKLSMFFQNVSRQDAIKLASWWNAHHPDVFIVRKALTGKLYNVLREKKCN